MIETVKKFIEEFIKLEQEVRTLDFNENKKDLFNEKLLQMEAFAIPEMKNTFGVILKDENYVEFEEIVWEDDIVKPEPSQETLDFIASIDTSIQFRHLYKIEEYPNNLYKVFLSIANPQGKGYGDCFLIRTIESNNKIVAKYFLDDEYPQNIKWQLSSGDKNELFDQQVPPINLERYLEPTGDKISMELHLK
jgi:hypothetical protein